MTNRKTSPPIRIADLAARLRGEAPAELAQAMAHGMSTLEEADGTQVSFATAKHAAAARASKALAVIVPRSLAAELPNAIAVDDAMAAMLEAMAYFWPDAAAESTIHPSAVVAPTATLGTDVSVGPNAVVEDGASIGDGTRIEAGAFIGERVIVGKGCWIGANVSVRHECVLGDRVRIHPNSVIGSDGFRYEVVAKRLRKIPQVGNVVIGNDVEIGSCTAIDRAFLTSTKVGDRTKIDNLVQIGHNVEIGSDCIIVAQVGIAGSTKLGRGVVVAGAAVIKDHLKIGDGARIGGRSTVGHHVPAGADIIGSPAVDIKTFARLNNFKRDFSKHWEKLRKLLGE